MTDASTQERSGALRRRILATSAALALGASFEAAARAPLGRLILTPAQRAALDAGASECASAACTGTAEAGFLASADQVRFEGLARREDGSASTWLNGRQIEFDKEGASEFPHLMLLRDGRLRHTASGGAITHLRVGDGAAR